MSDTAIEALRYSEFPNSSDLISRRAAIDKLEHKALEPDYYHKGEDWYDGMNSAVFELDNVPSAYRPTGEWIPCSEERPEFPCLACDKFEQIFIPVGIVTVGKLYYDGLQFNGNVEEFLKGEKTGYGARVLPRKIVAWMPLPEPWKGVDDGSI